MACGFLTSAFEENSDFLMFLACFPAHPPRKGSVMWCLSFPGWSCAHMSISLLGKPKNPTKIGPYPKNLET